MAPHPVFTRVKESQAVYISLSQIG